MKAHNGGRRGGIRGRAAIFLVTAGVAFGASSPSADAQTAAPEQSVTGTLSTVHGDPHPESTGPHRHRLVHVLTDEAGRSYQVEPGAGRAPSGLSHLDRREVTVRGRLSRPEAGPSVIAASSVKPTGSAPAAAAPVSGPQRFATILCRFSSSTTVTPRDVGYVQGLMGDAYPGISHFWQESSYGLVSNTGSVVKGWYNLRRPRTDYVVNNTLDHHRAAQDCTAAADADVFFPDYAGINLLFNEELDGAAWGGSSYLTLDRVTKVWPTTWMPPWGYANQGVLGHEMGHAYGLPHSSGPYGAVYDSRWDVMSGGRGAPHPTYGALGTHTIAYHKDRLGWIPPSRKYLAAANSCQVVTIDRLSQTPATAGYLMAQIPTADNRFYTVEARRNTGYDSGRIPGEAIVIHDVLTTRPQPANVVDQTVDNNPNDAGAMWLPGERFTDATLGVTIEVLASTPAGWSVRITRGAGTCAVVGTGTGLMGQYFDDMALTPSAHRNTRIDPFVSFNWGIGSPYGAIAEDTFSVRWTGEVEAQVSETYTFHPTTDDGVRLWIDGQLLIDRWVDQGATEWSGSIPLVAGRRYAIKMEYYESSGAALAQLQWSSPSTPKAVVPTSQLHPPLIGSGSGLKGEYFDNVDLTGLKGIRYDGWVDFSWPDAPHTAVAPDTFSVRWTGEIQAQYSQTYAFHLNLEGGARLWVDNRLLVDRWADSGPAELTGTIALTAGVKVPIRIDYYDSWLRATAQLRWSSPSTVKQIVPATQLHPATTYLSLPAVNFPSHYIDHGTTSATLTHYQEIPDRRTATFKLVGGRGDPSGVSFESIDLPGWFLRHQGFQLKLSPWEDTMLFRWDSTFHIVSGLADTTQVSFRSINYPENFIRHRDYHVYVESGADDLFRKDSTFTLGAALSTP